MTRRRKGRPQDLAVGLIVSTGSEAELLRDHVSDFAAAATERRIIERDGFITYGVAGMSMPTDEV
ncbi:hypothetical protein [Vallicoccus soli]|nr:hypothetical protein [Vallicoccus soli]